MKQEDIEADLQQARNALNLGQYDDAYRIFLNLSEQGSPYAWLNLGWMHDTGSGVPPDHLVASNYYRKAAEAGLTIAYHYLGMLGRKHGNLNEAISYFKLAAADGYLPSIYWVGSMYFHGEGVSQDYLEAKRYLDEAERRGHLFAKRDLAMGHIRGLFGRKRPFLGIAMLLKSWISSIRVAFKDSNSEKMS